MSRNAKEIREDNVEDKVQVKDENEKNRLILEEITIEELAVDGICGIY
jgi:mycofactocin precursor